MGIDCPESKMPFGQEAKWFKEKMFFISREDGYGGIVGDNGNFVQVTYTLL